MWLEPMDPNIGDYSFIHSTADPDTPSLSFCTAHMSLGGIVECCGVLNFPATFNCDDQTER